MANTKITELTAVTALAGTDVFPVVDVSASTTNKVSVEDLLRNAPDGTASAPSIANAGDQDTGILFPAADSVGVSTGGTQRLVIDSSGNVGVATASPAAKLDVNGNTLIQGRVQLTSSTPDLLFSVPGGGLDSRIHNDGSGNLIFGNGTNSNTPTERLRIDSSGNVGIGTSSPSSKLSVQAVNSNTTSFIESLGTINGSQGSIFLRGGSAAGYYYDFKRNGTNGNLEIQGNQTNFNNICLAPTSGNVGVGTTSPQNNLHLSSSSSATRLQITNSTTGEGSSDGTVLVQTGNTFLINNRENDDIYFAVNNSEAVRINNSGNVGIGTSSPDDLLHISASSSPTLRIENTDTTGSVSQILGAIEFEGNDSSTNADGIRAKVEAEYRGVGGQTNLRFYAAKENVATPYLALDVGPTVINFNTDNTERMRIDSSGRLGLGTTSPDHLLEIKSASFDNGIKISTSAVQNAVGNVHGRLVFEGRNAAGTVYETAKIQSVCEDSHGTRRAGLAFVTAGSAPGVLSEKLRIDHAGRVGIGVTDPGYELEIGGNSNIQLALTANTTDGNSQIYFGDSGNDDAGALIYRHASDSLAFEVNASERLRIDNDGRLLVGTSSDVSGSTDSKLQVISSGGARIALGRDDTSVASGNTIGDIQFYANDQGSQDRIGSIRCTASSAHSSTSKPTNLLFETTSSSSVTPTERVRIDSQGRTNFFSGANVIGAKTDDTAGTSTRLFFGSHSATGTVVGGTISFTVFSNGNVQNTNNSYGAISDSKLKENIVDASSQWNDIKDIRVRNYNFIEGQTHTQLGVVAQEVETVSPGLVSESPDIDDDGNDLGTVTKSVNYSVLYMKAVKALQEAMDRIETLETKVAALEAQ